MTAPPRPVPSSPRSDRWIRNALFNYLGYFWRVVLVLVATPILVRGLGRDAYGVYALVLNVVGYLVVLDLGLGEAVIKYVAESPDSRRRNVVINTTFFSYLVLGVLGSGAFSLATYLLVPWVFRIPQQLAADGTFAFYVASLAFCLNLPLTTFPAVLHGLQRLDLANKLTIGISSVHTATIVAVVLLGQGLRAVVLAAAVVGVLGLAVHLLAVRRVFPEFRLTLRLARRGEMRRLLRFGLLGSVGMISGIVIYECDVTLIGIFLPVGFVTFYAVANRLAVQIAKLSHLVDRALFPAISQLHGEHGLGGVGQVYRTTTVAIMLITIPATWIIVAYADVIIELWLGRGFEQAVFPLRLLSIAWFVNAVGAASTTVSKGVGKPGIQARYALVAAIGNVGLDIVLIPRHGVAGAVVATLAAQLVSNVLFIRTVCRELAVPALAQFGRIGKVLLLGGASGGVLLYRPAHHGLLLVQTALFLALFLWVSWRWLLAEPERQRVRRSLRRLRVGCHVGR